MSAPEAIPAAELPNDNVIEIEKGSSLNEAKNLDNSDIVGRSSMLQHPNASKEASENLPTYGGIPTITFFDRPREQGNRKSVSFFQSADAKSSADINDTMEDTSKKANLNVIIPEGANGNARAGFPQSVRSRRSIRSFDPPPMSPGELHEITRYSKEVMSPATVTWIEEWERKKRPWECCHKMRKVPLKCWAMIVFMPLAAASLLYILFYNQSNENVPPDAEVTFVLSNENVTMNNEATFEAIASRLRTTLNLEVKIINTKYADRRFKASISNQKQDAAADSFAKLKSYIAVDGNGLERLGVQYIRYEISGVVHQVCAPSFEDLFCGSELPRQGCPGGFNGANCDKCLKGHFGLSCQRCPECGTGSGCSDGVQGTGLCTRCPPGFNAAGCNDCVEGFWGDQCQPCTVTCSGRGHCSDGRQGTGQCVCDTNFSGNMCDSCDQGFAGSNCDVICSPATTCSGRGTCVRSDRICACAQNAVGANCNACAPGFTGETCSVRVTPTTLHASQPTLTTTPAPLTNPLG